MFAAKQIYLGRSAKAAWTNPYVTDGLVAQYDGEWNAGGGVHDAAAAKWKDLIGNRDWTELPYNFVWTDISAASNSNGWYNISAVRATENWNVQYSHIEVCGKCFSGKNSSVCFCLGNSRMFGILPTNNRGFQFASGKPTMGGGFYSPWSVAATLDSSNNITSCYYNSEARTANLGTSTWLSANYVRFAETSSYRFYGEIFSLRLYSRALTAAEVAANHAIDKERFNLP